MKWWDDFAQDARFAWRGWLKRPGAVTLVIVSLALGIGANTAIFSVVNTLLLKDLPYRDANRLMYVTEYWPHEPIVPGPPSPDFANWRANSKLVEDIAAYGGGAALNLTGNGDPEHIQGTMVTHNLLSLLGTTFELGRNFAPDEDRPGGPRAAILGYGLWMRRFGGSRDTLGKTIALNGVDHTIIGVLPAGFRFPDNNFREELLIPMALPPDVGWHDDRNFRLLRVLVLAKPGVTPKVLKQEFSGIVAGTAKQEPPQMVTMRRDMEVRVTPLRDWLTGNIRRMILILEATVLIVLLIACLNIAALQVAVAIARRKEMALRAAVGAGAGRLVRQVLTENVLLSVLAGCLGIGLAGLSLHAVRSFLPANLHLANSIALDRTVLICSGALAVFTGLLTGLIPALSAARVEVHDMVKEGDDWSARARGPRRLHGSVVIAEVAAATVLLAGSGLLIRTFIRLATADIGFEPQGVLTLKIAPSPSRYAQRAAKIGFYREVLDRTSAIPGVQYAAIGGGLPLVGSMGAAGIGFQDRPAAPAGGRPSIPVAFVSPDYFRALGIPMLRGRAFTRADREGAPLVAIVNQAFAEEFFPGQDALGKRIEVGSRDGSWREIVGIAGNVKQSGRRTVDPYAVYGPLSDAFEPETFVILKTGIAPENLAAAAAKAVHSVDPKEPVFEVATMRERLRDSLSAPRSTMTLITLFAGIAFLLATVGIVGVVAYTTSRRRHEIGIRMALGASNNDILRMVLGSGMALVAAGIALGIAGAVALTRAMGSLVEGMRTNDPATLVAVATMFLLVSVVTCLVPARWAARLDPAAVLRQG